MKINFVVTRRYIVLFCILTSYFVNITSSAVETPSFDSKRYKREIYFRPLFVYKQEQQRHRQRLKKIQEIYLQQQNTDQQHLENYPSVLINNEFYQSVPLNQLSNPQQPYEQQYYQQYYNKYFQQYPQNSYNVL